MSGDILAQIDAALADASACFCGCSRTLTAASPSPWYASEECQTRWSERRHAGKSGTGKAPVQASVASPVLQRMLRHPASPWLTREDITGRINARAGEAFRAEVLRQGLTECEVDGVAWRHLDGRWVSVESLRRENAENWAAVRRTLDETERVLGHIKQLAPPARRPWWQWRPW